MLTSATSSPISCARSPTSRPQSHASPRSFTATNPRITSASTSSPRPFTDPAARPASPVAVFNPPRPQTVDAGTQYTPPDWPPTDPRSSLSRITQDLRTAGKVKPGARYNPHDETPSPTTAAPLAPEPAEPQLRITPQSSLNTSSRRPHSEEQEAGQDAPSSSKRVRQGRNGEKVKTMPADYSTCDTKILASIIAEMLMRLIQHNDEIPLKDGQLTRFHSRAPPGISVHDYLARLTFHATLSPPILLSMVFLIDRLSANFPTFIINSLTVHRFLITAATVASKGLSDSFWTNQTYARVGGVSVKELALLELELLMKCDWTIVPSPESLVDYYKGLVEQSEEYVVSESSTPDDVPMDDAAGKERDTSDTSTAMDTTASNG